MSTSAEDSSEELPVRGKFITFEGGEGSGKTTQAALLADYLRTQGHDVVLTREPGGTPGGMEIRKLLVEGEDNRWLPKTELLLIAAARVEHWGKVIKPALLEGKWVVCDRFSDSTIAYQGYGRGLGVDHIEIIGGVFLPKSRPDLTILLNVDVEVGLKRAHDRDVSVSRFEKLGVDFHQRVKEGFQELAEDHPKRIKVVDSNVLAKLDIHYKIVELVQQKFSLTAV